LIGLLPSFLALGVDARANNAGRTAWPPARTDPFWPAPPPAPKPVLAPPAPVIAAPTVPARSAAPPFDYRYLGSFAHADGSRVVFLLKGDRVISARAGQTLDGNYVIDTIDETRITVRHPELDQPVVLRTDRSANAP